MKTKPVVVLLAVAVLAFTAAGASALPPINQMEGYYKFGYFDGNTYAAKAVPGIGAIKVYVLPDTRTIWLGVIVGDAIYFVDQRDNDAEWGVLTQVNDDMFLVTAHNADTGETKEMTVVRITEQEANEIVERNTATAEDEQCLNNLKHIGVWLHLFAQDHDGELPYDLSELYPDYATSKSIFVCPARGGSFHDFDTDYEYIPGFRVDSPNPGEEVVVIEVQGNHSVPAPSHNVLYLDGHVNKVAD